MVGLNGLAPPENFWKRKRQKAQKKGFLNKSRAGEKRKNIFSPSPPFVPPPEKIIPKTGKKKKKLGLEKTAEVPQTNLNMKKKKF